MTDEYLISTDSEDSEFSLGTVEITTTEVIGGFVREAR